jgi:hypothetical protein
MMRHNAQPLGKTIIAAFSLQLPCTFGWKLIHINHPAALKAFFHSRPKITLGKLRAPEAAMKNPDQISPQRG